MPKIYSDKEPLLIDRVSIAKPVNKNGSHFIKIHDIDDPIYFLAPKCFTKQGFVSHGKKMFCDFVFSNDNSDFFSWLENLEEKVKAGIFENRDKWFETPLDEHDIESSMTPPYKPYKSGKFFIIRANVPTALGKINIKVYDEHEEETEPEAIKENTNVLAVLEFQGIRCGVRSFQFEIELKQILIVEPEKIFEKCVISKPAGAKVTTESAPKVADAVPKVADAIPKVADALPKVADAVPKVADAIPKVTSGLPKVADAIPKVTSGLPKVADAIPKVSDIVTPEPFYKIEDDPFDETFDSISREATVVANEPDVTFNKDSTDLVIENVDALFSSPTIANHKDGYDVTKEDLISECASSANATDVTQIEILDDSFPLDSFNAASLDEPPIRLKSRNDVYYKLYKETRQRARDAKQEALANYLEAKRIKTTYLLEDASDSDSDLDELESTI